MSLAVGCYMTDTPKTQPKPQAFRRSLLSRILLGIVLSYSGIVLLLTIIQRSLMYAPAHVATLPALDSGFPDGQALDIAVATKDELTLHGWQILPSGKSGQDLATADQILAEGDPVFLFFPGNGGHRGMRLDDFLLLTNLPAHVFAFDYRGYAENKGSPSEAKLMDDAHLVWQYLTEVRKISPSRIVLFGESLGGGVATGLASALCVAKTPPAGLVLRSTFSSMVDAAGGHYPWVPVSLVLQDRYLSTSAIRHVTCPILILHGTRDQIVPIKLGRKLFQAAPDKSLSGIPKTFVELIHSDHNDVLLVDEIAVKNSLSQFMKRLDVTNQQP